MQCIVYTITLLSKIFGVEYLHKARGSVREGVRLKAALRCVGS